MIYVSTFFSNINPVILALIGGIFCFIMTSFGSAIVFLFRTINKRIMNAMMAISAGVMLAASFFSLINPAINLSIKLEKNIFLTIILGFILGSLFIFMGNSFFKRIEPTNTTNIRRSLILFISITLHNIPEGLAVGVAFGNIMYGGSLISAVMLSIGIAIQNFPEGAAISLPLRREGTSTFKSFIFGSLSGLVEPLCALLGSIMAVKINYILPIILSFAASAMIYVTVLELIPEAQSDEKKDLMALLFMLGFILMMFLDITL